MSDHSTRAHEPKPNSLAQAAGRLGRASPEADPRKAFTLGKEDAQALHSLCAGPAATGDARNAWWAEAGERLGFVWSTVADLYWTDLDGARTAEPGLAFIGGAAFTAWPTVQPIAEDADALTWLKARYPDFSSGAELFEESEMHAAFAAGRDRGFAMGSACPQPNPTLGWDGMELIREAAAVFREYEAHHRAKVGTGEDQPGIGRLEQVARFERDTLEQAERNATIATKLEAFLADPTQSVHVHDGLREAREDNALAMAAGWHAAMAHVVELVDSGRAQAGSGIPPLVLLDRLAELTPPEDVDGVLQPLRDPMGDVLRLRVALDEWFEKTRWVDEALRTDVFKSLGIKPQWGRHKADTLRTLVERLNSLLGDMLARTVVGLRVQATADVLQAMGISDWPDAPLPEPEAANTAPSPADADRLDGAVEAVAELNRAAGLGLSTSAIRNLAELVAIKLGLRMAVLRDGRTAAVGCGWDAGATIYQLPAEDSVFADSDPEAVRYTVDAARAAGILTTRQVGPAPGKLDPAMAERHRVYLEGLRARALEERGTGADQFKRFPPVEGLECQGKEC